MLGLRVPEFVIILVVLVLVFGANKIPQIGDALGRGIHNFKKTFENGDSVDVAPEAQQGKPPHASATAMPHAGADQKVASAMRPGRGDTGRGASGGGGERKEETDVPKSMSAEPESREEVSLHVWPEP